MRIPKILQAKTKKKKKKEKKKKKRKKKKKKKKKKKYPKEDEELDRKESSKNDKESQRSDIKLDLASTFDPRNPTPNQSIKYALNSSKEEPERISNEDRKMPFCQTGSVAKHKSPGGMRTSERVFKNLQESPEESGRFHRHYSRHLPPPSQVEVFPLRHRKNRLLLLHLLLWGWQRRGLKIVPTAEAEAPVTAGAATEAEAAEAGEGEEEAPAVAARAGATVAAPAWQHMTFYSLTSPSSNLGKNLAKNLAKRIASRMSPAAANV